MVPETLILYCSHRQPEGTAHSRRSFIAAPPTGHEGSLYDQEDTRATSQRLLQAAADARQTIARYTVLVFELAMLKQRGHIDTEIGRRWLSDEGLLVEETASKLIGQRQHWLHQLRQHVPRGLRSGTSWCQGHANLRFWPGFHNISKMPPHGAHSRRSTARIVPSIERARSNSSDMMDRTICKMLACLPACLPIYLLASIHLPVRPLFYLRSENIDVASWSLNLYLLLFWMS